MILLWRSTDGIYHYHQLSLALVACWKLINIPLAFLSSQKEYKLLFILDYNNTLLINEKADGWMYYFYIFHYLC